MFCQTINAQNNIRGKVLDGNVPLDGTEIDMFNDSTLIQSVLSDTEGIFKLSVGDGLYSIKIRRLGDILLDTTLYINRNIDLGNLNLHTAKNLKGIMVMGKKRIIVNRVDRIIYNVENDIYSKGKNLLGALSRAPRIEVSTDGTLRMIGRNQVIVMLDGRLLTESESSTILKSLQSEDIARIEIIPIPPSRYSSNGNCGMVNIIRKTNPNLGIQGNINVTPMQSHNFSIADAVNLNYCSNKLEMMLNLSHSHMKGDFT